MGFSRQEYWSGLPCPPPGDLPDPGMDPTPLMPAMLAGGFFTSWATWEVHKKVVNFIECFFCIYGYDRRRQWQPTPVLLPGKSHGWRSLEACSSWRHWQLDTTERLHFHFSLSCIGEGNGNPLQCSCLENPRDGGAWWAAVFGVTQSRTWLKQLSSSSSSMDMIIWFLSQSFDMINYINLFKNVEPTLQTWDKCHSVVVYNTFIHSWIWFATILLKILHLCLWEIDV